jgi:outer membrane lipoprotein-sorting protein
MGRYFKHMIIFSGFILCLANVQAQFTHSDESDPAAKKILKQIKERFEHAGAFSVDFHMSISFPGQEPMKQEGTLIQQGGAFRLDMKDYLIISNKSMRWVYVKQDNTVNIYNAQSDDSWMTPKDFLNIYDSPEFVYALMSSEFTGAKSEHWIEFKSLEPDSEYSKVRMVVNKETNEIKSIRAFSNDGSSYELFVGEINYKAIVDQSAFQFAKKNHPGVIVEDLRID